MNKDELQDIVNPENYKWIKVPKYEDKKHDIVEEYNVLLGHHRRETTFLINKCRELAGGLLKMNELNNQMAESQLRAVQERDDLNLEVQKLRKRDEELSRLEANGVDNWEGYSN